MNISKEELVEMIAGAIRLRLVELRSLNEFSRSDDEDEEPEDSTDPKGKSEIGNMENDPVANPKQKPKKPPAGGDVDADPGMDGAPQGDDGGESSEQQASDERDALDLDGDAGSDPTGSIDDAISGKTVQSIAMEPKSKIMPGAKEVVLAFNETTDQLRILIQPSGKVIFSWRNRLHDIP